MRAYRLLKDREIRGEICAKSGETVYPCKGHDYGCASDDTAATGIEHISVTLDRAGGYPFFTIPRPDVDPFDAPDFEPLTDAHVMSVCNPGAGAATCRYLTMGRDGWCCEKITGLRLTLDLRADRGDMTAIGDNCEGRAALQKAVA
jgi:hypothetical protein